MNETLEHLTKEAEAALAGIYAEIDAVSLKNT